MIREERERGKSENAGILVILLSDSVSLRAQKCLQGLVIVACEMQRAFDTRRLLALD